MLIPLWQNAPRRAKRAIGWIVAGVVALAVEHLVPGWWFIIAGAVAGAIAEGFASMNADLGTYGVLIAIAAMAVATYPMRVGGFWLMGHVPLTPRLRRMLEALPGTVVVATVLPILVREGVAGGRWRLRRRSR